MTDFPVTDQLPLFIHPFTEYGCGQACARLFAAANPGAITWVANQAIYMPVTVPWPYPVARVFWANGSTVTSNVDFGIYTPSGKRIYSTGSTAQSGASALQYVTPTVPFVLPSGRYFFAYVCDGTTSRSYGYALATQSNGALAGMLSQATALPLPASATFASYVTPGLQLAGITRTAVGTVF